MSSNPQELVEARGGLRLEPGTIDVWPFTLRSSNDCLDLCREQLSPAEATRARRFVSQADRDAYSLAHGVLRHLLSRYCGVPAHDLRFERGPADKPYLHSEPKSGVRLSFNLTHCGERALVAVGDGREVGVDLEQLRSEIEALEIGRRYFFGSEFEDIANAPHERQAERFFRYWVAKEAVLKAEGVGLGFPLDRFRVTFGREADVARVVTFDPATLSDGWTVRMLPCELGWFAALAAKGDGWRVSVRTTT